MDVTLCYQSQSLTGVSNDSAWHDGRFLRVHVSLQRVSDNGSELSTKGLQTQIHLDILFRWSYITIKTCQNVQCYR